MTRGQTEQLHRSTPSGFAPPQGRLLGQLVVLPLIPQWGQMKPLWWQEWVSAP